jgi:hypothetical protein
MSISKKNIKLDFQIENKIQCKFDLYYLQLTNLCFKRHVNILEFNIEQIRNYFSDGLDIYSAFRQLLSDIPES